MSDFSLTGTSGAPSGTAPKGTVDVDIANADVYIYNSAWEKLAKNVAGAILITSLAAGSNGQVLTTTGGVPAWGTATGTISGVVAGNGLIGGGSSGSVTLDVAAADATITITANAIAVGQIANANVATGAAIAYSKLALTGSVVDGDIVGLAWTKIAGHPTDLGGYGITDAAASSVTLTAGAGMTGGGNLTSPRTFNVVANADGSIVVNADDIQVGVITSSQHGNQPGGALHPGATTTVAGFIKMTTDLAGTGASPIVVAITGSGDTAILRCNTVAWDSALSSPTIQQSAIVAPSGHGAATTVSGQNSLGGGASIGGPLHLSSGFGATSGSVDLQLGGTTTLSLTSAAAFQWDQAVNAPLFTQAAAASGNSGVTTTHRAQDGVGTNKSGGLWRAFGGAKTGTGLRGGFQLGFNGAGAEVMIEAAEVVSGSRVLAMAARGAVSTSNTGSAPGDGTLWIADCATVPTAKPSNGVGLWQESGKGIRSWGVNNLVRTLCASGYNSGNLAFEDAVKKDFTSSAAGSNSVVAFNFRDYGCSTGEWVWTAYVLITYLDLVDLSQGAWLRVYTGIINADGPLINGFSTLVRDAGGSIISPAPTNETINVTGGAVGTNQLVVTGGSTRTDGFHWFVDATLSLVKGP